MDLDILNGVNSSEINRAGPRYTPGIKPDAPNIEVEHVLETFDALAYSNRWKNRLQNLASNLRDNWKQAPTEARDAFEDRKQNPAYVADLLIHISARSPDDDPRELGQLTRATRFAEEKLNEPAQELEKAVREADDREGRNGYDRRLSKIRDVQRALRDVSRFVDGPEHELLRDRILFLRGDWGTGKTHFFCDLTEQRMKNDLPTLLVLAESLSTDTKPLQSICHRFDSISSVDELLDSLESLGRRNDQRSLLLIDGINEGNREVWKRELGNIAQKTRQYPYLGVAISCRTPFDKQIVTTSVENQIAYVEHHGFRDNEFDAQAEFFSFYGIPTPHVPFLTPEFSRPLFLKILCEAITRSSEANPDNYLESIAAGQRGMTDVLEHFARVAGEDIENQFDLERKSCWNIIKGTQTGASARSGIAGIMADELREFVTRAEATQAIVEETGCSEAKANNILDVMVSEGLLSETLHFNEESVEVLRFPYQRFGDHIIARHLLAEHLNTESIETIRRSFYVNRPLGKIFELREHSFSFEHPGLATALMIEFPERVKRAVPKNNRELAYYIPKKRALAEPVKASFLDSLYWRRGSSFSRQTDELIAFFLNEESTQSETLEILVGLASRPSHPRDATTLCEYLETLGMAERDLVWSEFLRNRGEQSNVHRVLDWVERSPIHDFGEKTARNTLILLSTFLTTTNRYLRDRITKTLYDIGLSYPEILFEETFRSLSFNDPYLPERMLASSYGIAMSLWADPNGSSLREKLPEYSNTLLDLMFAENAPHATTHELMRQYAKGIVELAMLIDVSRIPNERQNLIDYPMDQITSEFPKPENIDPTDLKEVDPAFHMDFSNYTVGKLVPDRSNYHDSHPKYQDILKQIKWRVRNLGYSHEDFEQIDEMLDRMNHAGGERDYKIDRYGKKYSWIAYFEMYGVRVDEGVLPRREELVRPSDCDIDPSFPPDPSHWKPELPELFSDDVSDPVNWISRGPEPEYDHLVLRDRVDGIDGPWVLMNGYIEQADEFLRIPSRLRGLLLDESEISDLQRKLDRTEFPGNLNIPDPHSDIYTFAGEIPWSERFGSHLRADDGEPIRNIGQAFSEPKLDGIEVEIPVHKFGWESYHSKLNQIGIVRFVAPALCNQLKLVNHAQTLDLFDKHGGIASLYRVFDSDAQRHTSRLLYLRQDLLDEYLNETDQTIAWVVWGERDLTLDKREEYEDELSVEFREHNHIHKDIVTL